MTKRRIRLLAFAGIVLTALNMRAAVTGLPPLIGRMAPDLGLSPGFVGALGMLPTAMFAASAFATPPLLRRLRLPHALFAMMAATAAGQLLRVAGPSTAALVAGSLVALFAIGVTNTVAPLAVRAYFPEAVPRMSTAYMLAMQTGMMAAPLAAEPIAAAAGSWRVSLASWALLALAAALPWIPLLRAGADSVAAAGRGGPPPAAARGPAGAADRVPVHRSPVGLGLLAMFGCTSLSTYALMMFIPRVIESAGMSAATGGAMLSWWSALGALIAVLGPWALGRLRDPYPLLAGFLLVYCIGNTGLFLAPAAAPWLWVTLSGLGPISFPMALTLINLRARTAAGARALSAFAQGGGYTLACAGPLLTGMLHEATAGWAAPLALLLAATAVVAVGGRAATRERFVEDTLPAAGPRRG